MFLLNLPPVVRGILIALGVAFILCIAAPSIMFSLLPLFSQTIWQGHLWRLITYPFYFVNPGADLIGNLFRLLWIGMLIVFFGGELESIIHSKRFGLALGATIIVGGLIFALLSPEGTLVGPQIITMFILVGFSYLWPERPISIFGIFSVKVWILTAVIFALTVIPSRGFSLDTSASNVFAPLFGALASLIFFHVTYQQYSFGRAFLNRFTSKPGVKKSGKSATVLDVNDPSAIQRRIDMILDKISRGGMQSLSQEERDFLLRHSQNT